MRENQKLKQVEKIRQEIASYGFDATVAPDPCRSGGWFATLTCDGSVVGVFVHRGKRIFAMYRALDWARTVKSGGVGV